MRPGHQKPGTMFCICAIVLGAVMQAAGNPPPADDAWYTKVPHAQVDVRLEGLDASELASGK